MCLMINRRFNMIFGFYFFLLGLFLSFPFIITSISTSTISFPIILNKKGTSVVTSSTLFSLSSPYFLSHRYFSYPSFIISQTEVKSIESPITFNNKAVKIYSSLFKKINHYRACHLINRPGTVRELQSQEEKSTISSSKGEEEQGLTRKLCRRCKQYYYEEKNTFASCRYHSGKWMSAENSKHYGTRSGGEKIGLVLFWDCCNGKDIYAGGCCTGKHISYDD